MQLGAEAQSVLGAVKSGAENAQITFEIHTTFRKICKLSKYVSKKYVKCSNCK